MSNSTACVTRGGSRTARAALRLVLLPILLLLVGCGASRPVLYQSPNPTVAGDPAAQQSAIDECIASAKQSGAAHNQAVEAGKQTGGAAAVGAAAGGAAGAIGGHAGRGAAMGAAGGAAGGFTRWMLKSGGLDDIQKRYVETCLRERGYQVLGWQ
jgi:outer membrane lipoprotein SlyB